MRLRAANIRIRFIFLGRIASMRLGKEGWLCGYLSRKRVRCMCFGIADTVYIPECALIQTESTWRTFLSRRRAGEEFTTPSGRLLPRAIDSESATRTDEPKRATTRMPFRRC